MLYRVAALKNLWEIPRNTTVIEPLFINGADLMPAMYWHVLKTAISKI